MTTFGIISDIHGNLEALTKALEALSERQVDRIVCLGDIVGYNPASNECIDALHARGIDSVAGNHDWIALGRLNFDRCADKPAFTLRRTRKDLSDTSRDLLATLPAQLVLEGDIVAVHGGVDDVQEYLFTPDRVGANAVRLAHAHPAARICFFGHTHDARLYSVHKNVASVRAIQRRTVVSLDERGRIYFVNPGSIDASRKHDGARGTAEFAVFDSSARTIEFCAVDYDDARVEADARTRGYRMRKTDEWLYRTARFVRRGKAYLRTRAERALRAITPTNEEHEP
jgi:predicted phosphodiesterase